MSKLQLSLSQLAKGIGHVSNEENEKLDVLLEKDDNYYFNLENSYYTKQHLQNIKNDSQLIPVHKTFITRKGALILFSEDLALKNSWKKSSKINSISLKEADDSRFNLINTCNDLSLEILKYGNTSEHVRKGENIFLKFIHPYKNTSQLFRLGLSQNQCISTWCSLYNDFTDGFVQKGHVTDKLLLAKKAKLNLTNTYLSSKSQPFESLPSILEKKNSSSKKFIRSSFSTETSKNIDNEDLISDGEIKVLRYEANDQFHYVDYEKLKPYEKENILAQLLVAAHEFQDKTTSELYLTKTVLKKCISKDEVIIDMRQAIKNLVSSPLKDQVLQGTTEKVSEKKEVIKDKSIVNNSFINDEELIEKYLSEKDLDSMKTATVQKMNKHKTNDAKKPILFNMKLYLNEKDKNCSTLSHDINKKDHFWITSNFGRKTFRENIFETSPNFCPYEAKAYSMDEEKKPLSVVHMTKQPSLKNTKTDKLSSNSEKLNEVNGSFFENLNFEDKNHKSSNRSNENMKKNTKKIDKKNNKYKSTEHDLITERYLSKISQTTNFGLRTKLIPVQEDSCKLSLKIPFSGMRGGKINSRLSYKSHLDQPKKIKTQTKPALEEKAKYASISFPDGQVLPIGGSIKYDERRKLQDYFLNSKRLDDNLLNNQSYPDEQNENEVHSNENLVKEEKTPFKEKYALETSSEKVVMHAKKIARIVITTNRPNSGLNDDAKKAADLWNNVNSIENIYYEKTLNGNEKHTTSETRNKVSNESCLVKIPQASFSELKEKEKEKSFIKSEIGQQSSSSEKTKVNIKSAMKKNKGYSNLSEDKSGDETLSQNYKKEKIPNELKQKNRNYINKDPQELTEMNLPPSIGHNNSKCQETKKGVVLQNNVERKSNKIKQKKMVKKSKVGVIQNTKNTKIKKIKSEKNEDFKEFMSDDNENNNDEKSDLVKKVMKGDIISDSEEKYDSITLKKDLETQVQKISECSDEVKKYNTNSLHAGSIVSASDSDYECVIIDDDFEDSIKEVYDQKQDRIMTENILKKKKGFNPPPDQPLQSQKKLTEDDVLAIKEAEEEAKMKLKHANEDRKRKRALAAEKRKQDVERKRREKEDKKLKEADEERRREVMRKQLEEERMQREAELRRKKEEAELERKKLLEEEENKKRKARQLAEREKRIEEERRKKREELLKIRKEEEKKRNEQKRLLEEEESERKRLEEEMLAKMAESDRLAYIEKMRKLKNEKDREELTRRLQAEEEARKAMEFARKQAILKAHEQALLQKKFEFLRNIKDEDERMIQAQRLSRAFNFSYFELLKLLGIDFSKQKDKKSKGH